MSRISALLLTTVLLLLAGCGGGDGKKDAKAGPFAFPTVSTDKVGEEPVIVLSFGYPSKPRDPEGRSAEDWAAAANRKPFDEVVSRI